MLTPDQINNLKHGDTVLVEAEVSSPLKEGAVVTHGCITHALPASKLYPLPSDSDRTFCHVVDNMVKPKHDPTRLFREGDEVRVVEKDGRTPTCFPVGKIKVGDIHTVIENEGGDAFINVKTEDGSKMMAPWFHLELVTPVEEKEPYFVIKGDLINGWDVCKQKNENICCTVATFTQGHTNAKAAAEAERDRLNAEWRKEQNNG